MPKETTEFNNYKITYYQSAITFRKVININITTRIKKVSLKKLTNISDAALPRAHRPTSCAVGAGAVDWYPNSDLLIYTITWLPVDKDLTSILKMGQINVNYLKMLCKDSASPCPSHHLPLCCHYVTSEVFEVRSNKAEVLTGSVVTASLITRTHCLGCRVFFPSRFNIFIKNHYLYKYILCIYNKCIIILTNIFKHYLYILYTVLTE